MIRKLPQELRNRFDFNFRGQRLDTLTPNELLILTAQSMVGIDGTNTDTIDFIRQTISAPWGEPWCVDFIQTCVAYVEEVKGVQSALLATENVHDLWNRSPGILRVAFPLPGNLILWEVLGNSLEGHAGIVLGSDSLLYSTVEGNTSDAASIDRNGNGVHFKKRARGGTKTFKELGFLRVFS